MWRDAFFLPLSVLKKEIVNKIEEQEDLRERAVLVAVIRDGQPIEQAEEYLAELEFLAETADIVTVRRFTLREIWRRLFIEKIRIISTSAYT